jgi:pimeloyl-ACP methyl ester carboxylesterase
VFPAADVRVLEGSGHWPHVDHPGAVVADLLPFLGRQLRPS